jgi:hypothetical protein
LRRLLPICLSIAAFFSLLPARAHASAPDFPAPSADELSMKSEPKAPGAPAIVLYREEIFDNSAEEWSVYMRVKILTEAGRSWATIELPTDNVLKLEARTVQPDGTILPFTDKPYKKLITKGKHWQTYRSVITLPGVQVGSIVEFRARYKDYYEGADWDLQSDLFTKREAFGLYPYAGSQVSYSGMLPNGSKPFKGHNVAIGDHPAENRDSYSILLTDVPAFESEEAAPPAQWAALHVNLYYIVSPTIKNKDDYWRETNQGWSDGTDKFLKPDSTIRKAAEQLVSPSDTDRQKAEKIYREIMTFNNTSYTQPRSAKEEKALHYKKLVTPADNWKQRRGSDDYLTLLYISLARAAGLHAYAMRVSDRRNHIFSEELWSYRQMDDLIAIVTIDGKDVFLDPGALYCPFGQLAWFHSPSRGVRQSSNGVIFADTPYSDFTLNRRLRAADLKMAADGSITGTARFEFYGQQAMELKQNAAESDNPDLEKAFEDTMRELMPVDTKVKLEKITGLKDLDAPVIVQYTVDGPFATRNSRHIILPAAFFRHFDDNFDSSQRKQPIILPYAFQIKDSVNIQLPPGVTVEAMPKDLSLPFQQYAVFTSINADSGDMIKLKRTLTISNIFYQQNQYTALHDFFGAIRSANTEQAVLKVEKQIAAR